MTDLQCAVTVLVLPAGTHVDVDAVRRERPVQVLSAAGPAAWLARALDAPAREVPGDGGSFAARQVAGLLTDLADEYRGECVVLVLPGEVFADLSAQLLPAGTVAPGARVRVDADGHRWQPWPSPCPPPAPS